MTAADDDAFWLSEADPAVDICDPSITVDACLDVILPELASYVDLSTAMILDLGCGIGRLTNPIQARHPSARVLGLDMNGNFIADAMYSRPGGGHRPVYVVADLDELGTISVSGWGDDGPRGVGEPRMSGYDAVFSMAVMQHIDNDRKRSVLRRVGAALAPGGACCFQYVEGTNSSRCMHDALIGDVREWCESAGLTVRRVQHDVLAPRWTWLTATRETE